jgi:uncharacterized delta-60 repeat protein
MRPARFLALATFLASLIALQLTANAAPGEVDSFVVGVSGEPYTTTVLPDAKLLFGGYAYFGYLPTTRTNAALFASDGTIDGNFGVGVPSIIDYVSCAVVQPDGKIMLGGAFRSLDGISQQYLGRINSDGSLDTNFAPVLNTAVLSMALQPDGRSVIGGYFALVNGASHAYIARLNTNGTLDTSFNPAANATIYSLALQPDGKIIVGGDFTTLNGSARSHIGRLNADGTLDTGFTPSSDTSVQCLLVQPDGKILVGGAIGTNHLWRLDSTGTMDTNFNPNVSSSVNTMALQADGKILIAGYFGSVGGVTRQRFARLNADGSLDAGLSPFTLITDPIATMAVQADGRFILGSPGRFDTATVQRFNIARVENDPVTQSLVAATTNRVQWLRGGSTPEAQFVTFEFSTNAGSTYTLLGNGSRISGGWELTGLSLPADGQLRARARTISGRYNGSSGLIERISYFGSVTVSNLSTAETYVEDTPLNLTDILVRAPDTTNITATLTLSTPLAGSLSTPTSGVVVATFNSTNGVWLASGPTPDVNAVLAAVIFRPATNYNANFTIATSVTNTVVAFTGSKNMTGTPVNDPPTASNLSANQFYTEDTPVSLTDIVISDVDSPNVTATLTLSTANAGSLTTATSGAVTSTYNAATGVWTAFGAIANVNTLLAGVTFVPAANYNANFTIATSVSDGVAPAITGTKNMFGTAVNDPPTATNLSAPETYTEDTPLNLIDIVVSDVDSANVTVTLTLSTTAAGSLTMATSGAVTSTYNAATGVWTASGAIANVNILLAGVSFNPATNYNSNFTIATSVSDGVAPAITGSKAMTGTAVNDPPTATNLSASETYTEDTPLNLVDIVVSDVDSSTVTATLTLSTTAAGSLTTATSGAVTSTYNAATGVWTASGAIANVNILLAGVSFNPATNYNSNFTIATSVSDGVAPAITGSKAATGTAVNDPPTATNLSAPESYTEDTPLNLIDIVVSDVDSANVTATLTLSPVAAGRLTTATSGAVTSTYNAATGVWTASGPIANVNTLLAGVSFNPATNYNSNFTIATSVSDGVAPAITGSKAMTGIAVNDPPTASNLSAAQTYTEDTPLNLTDIVISDVDSANAAATLTLSSVTAGSLSTGTSGAVTSTYNAASGVWIASGPIADVNALLAGVIYHPATNFNSNFTIATSVSDGVAPPITGSKALTGTAVNDMPVFTKGPDQSLALGTTNAQTVINWATGIDDEDPEVTQSLSFNLTNSNPALFTVLPSVSAIGTLTYKLTGTSGSATIGISLTDDGTAGGSALTTTIQTFTISVSSSVTPPVISSGSVLVNGAFQLTFTNTNNIAFSVLATTDLNQPASNWTVLGSSTNIGGGLHGFTDTDAANNANRYYLLRFP